MSVNPKDAFWIELRSIAHGLGIHLAREAVHGRRP